MFLPRQSVLRRYMMAFIGIAIAACAVLGGSILAMAMLRLQSDAEAAEQQRLEVAAKDFCSQVSVMDDIALAVQTSYSYHPSYLSRNAYNHVELLNQFERFAGYSPLIHEYFLYYPDLGVVFSSKAEYTERLFCQSYYDNGDPDDLRSLVEASGPFLRLDSMPQSVLYVFPIKFRMSAQAQPMPAYLLFELDEQAVATRYRTLFGIQGPLRVYYADALVLGAAQSEAGSLFRFWAEEVGLIFESQPDMNQAYPELNAFKRGMFWVIGAIALGFAVFAGVLAYANYLPIRRLANKLRVQSMEGKNELVLIERMMDHVLAESRGSMARLTESLEQISGLTVTLKQQILLLVFGGEYDDQLQSRMASVGMNFQRPVLCALHIAYDREVDGAALCRCVEATSDANVALYSTQLPGARGWAVAVCADDEDDMHAQIEVLSEVLTAQGFRVALRQSAPTGDAAKLASALAQAESGLRFEEEGSLRAAQWYDLARLERVKCLLVQGEAKEAAACAGQLVRELTQRCASPLIQRYLFVDMVYQLVDVGRQLGCAPSEATIQAMILTHDASMFEDALSRLAASLCAGRPKAASGPSASDAVLAYINAHAMDYAVCLDLVAEACSISTKQVSRIVKGATGQTFKEYLTDLRIRRAMQLLRGGASAMETAAQVGYQDISHFTKLFRAKTGHTPGQFKSMAI